MSGRGVFGGHEAVPFRILYYNSHIHKKNRAQTAEVGESHVQTVTSAHGRPPFPILCYYYS